MKKLSLIFVVGITLLSLVNGAELIHQANPNDPLKVEQWQLENGMRVLLSPNPDSAEIFMVLGVGVGSVDDPQDNTGLSHYLEHLLFKGSESLGTVDYQAEKAILDEINRLYAERAITTDIEARNELYRQIDTLSGEAAQYTIPNEYVTTMTLLGGNFTNAYTSQFSTCYLESIPSNELERLLTLQLDRFSSPVIRGFHTELETVYEEFNMYADRPNSVFYHLLNGNLFANNPKGIATIGLAEHLLNPSPIKVMEFFKTNYVPANMTLILVGGFEVEETVKLIENSLGKLPYQAPPERSYTQLAKFDSDETIEVEMQLPPLVSYSWRLPNLTDEECIIADALASVLSHSQAGVMTEEYLFTGKVLSASASFSESPDDNNAFIITIVPTSDSTPQDAEPFIMEALAKVVDQQYPDWMAEAIYNENYLELAELQESNQSVANLLAQSVYYREDWNAMLELFFATKNITQDEISNFVETHLMGNKLIVYRTWGEFEGEEKLEKLQLSPLKYPNINEQSKLYQELAQLEPAPIEPFLMNVDRDIDKLVDNEGNLYGYKITNTDNQTFSINLIYDIGTNYNNQLDIATSYFNSTGSATLSVADFKRELFHLGGRISMNSGKNQTTLSISGLAENMSEIIDLAIDKLHHPELNEQLLNRVKQSTLVVRESSIAQPQYLLGALSSYALYGDSSSYLTQLSTTDIEVLSLENITTTLSELSKYNGFILAYTPAESTHYLVSLKQVCFGAENGEIIYPTTPITSDKVYVVELKNSTQTQIMFVQDGELFNPDNYAIRLWFNTTFGGGMGSILFTELREKQALCYTTYAYYQTPTKPEQKHLYALFIGTENSKVMQALEQASKLQLPYNAELFQKNKNMLIKNFQSERMTKKEALSTALTYKELNLPANYREQSYQGLNDMAASQLIEFYKNNIKDKPRILLLVGDDIPVDQLTPYGEVEIIAIDQMINQ